MENNNILFENVYVCVCLAILPLLRDADICHKFSQYNYLHSSVAFKVRVEWNWNTWHSLLMNFYFFAEEQIENEKKEQQQQIYWISKVTEQLCTVWQVNRKTKLIIKKESRFIGGMAHQHKTTVTHTQIM